MSDPLGDAAGERPAVLERVSMSEICRCFLKRGWLAFGGPIGQVGLLQREAVERRRWITEDELACFTVPGWRAFTPASGGPLA